MTIAVSAPKPAGEQVRFRVADDQGRFGSSWTARSSRSSGDVVVSHREAGGWVHATFHAGMPGEWHFALTPSGDEQPPDEPRYVGVLRNPGEVAPGWLHAMRISIPTDELRANWVERAAVRPLITVRPWDAFDAVSIDIFLGGRTRSDLLVTASFPSGEIERGDGGTVAVVARPERVAEPLRPVRTEEVAGAVAGIRAAGWAGNETTRFVLFGVHDDGYLTQVELALDPD
jgi:hypothetical protein